MFLDIFPLSKKNQWPNFTPGTGQFTVEPRPASPPTQLLFLLNNVRDVAPWIRLGSLMHITASTVMVWLSLFVAFITLSQPFAERYSTLCETSDCHICAKRAQTIHVSKASKGDIPFKKLWLQCKDDLCQSLWHSVSGRKKDLWFIRSCWCWESRYVLRIWKMSWFGNRR